MPSIYRASIVIMVGCLVFIEQVNNSGMPSIYRASIAIMVGCLVFIEQV